MYENKIMGKYLDQRGDGETSSTGLYNEECVADIYRPLISSEQEFKET
jgi:hypothetical protein